MEKLSEAEDLSQVPKKVESAIVYRMRKNALRQCDDAASAFAKCTEARLFSAAWACRDLLNALNECTKHYTGPEVMDEVKRKWLRAGQPADADWDALFEGVQNSQQ